MLLVQLPVPNNPALNVPLAAGYLKAYAHAQGLLDRVEIELLPRHLADYAGDALLVDEIVRHAPDVLGLSLYTWNSERTLDIARRVKQQRPAMQVIVGGPEVQRDNLWVLGHPVVDIAVLGEGEQTFADLLTRGRGSGIGDQEGEVSSPHPPPPDPRSLIPGIAFRDDAGNLIFTPERPALPDLAVVPSPYLLGYLDTPPDGMLMIEVSRWCPYGCSFCLYGRNMGPKLGSRYFGLDRVLDEIAWGRDRGVQRVHFVEANLNLVPLFWPLMRALHDLNADHRIAFYAELRGEHLTDEVVAALDRANVRYVEVGLQTANPDALVASHRRTNLQKWAAGARRLYDAGIEVYLDVILGLPADDPAGVRHTLDFIAAENLGPYDVFTLQVLPGTAVRSQAAQYGLRFGDRPPYYVLQTDRFSPDDLQRLRRELKERVNLDPDAIEGMPTPRRTPAGSEKPDPPRSFFTLRDATKIAEFGNAIHQLAAHVDLVANCDLHAIREPLAHAITANPSTIFDLYLICDDHTAPAVDQIAAWRDALPCQPGYLDRVAVYGGDGFAAGHRRVSPRVFVVLPWTATLDPDSYAGVAEVVWQFELGEGDAIPFGSWRAAGGAGISLTFAPGCSTSYEAQVIDQVCGWERDTGRYVWLPNARTALAGPLPLLAEQHLTSARSEP